MHRDIKLENIMITLKGGIPTVKLIDFGLSQFLAPGDKGRQSFGTLSYSSPEIVLNLPQDHQTDIWSLGILLCAMIDRQLPFRGSDKTSTINEILTGPLPLKSGDVGDLINRLLERDSKKRITINEVCSHPYLSCI